MDLRIVLSTFLSVFLAELGDKTQITTFTMGAASGNRLSTFIGAATALVLSSLIAVTLADVIGKRVPVRYVQGGAGLLLVVMGAFYLISAARSS